MSGLRFPVPEGPTLYADIVKIIDTEHADRGVQSVQRHIPPAALERVREMVHADGSPAPRFPERIRPADRLRRRVVQPHREWGERLGPTDPEAPAS